MGKQVKFCEERVSQWRKILYYVKSSEFANAYEDAGICDKEKIDILIMSGNLVGLKKAVEGVRQLKLEGYSVLELRKLASVYRIAGYNNLPKPILIDRIRRIRRETLS